MKNIILVTLSGLVFLFCSSISLTGNAQDSDFAALKKQLETMEETIKKQQEMINVLKDKIETKGKVVANPTPIYREESEIERVIDNYLAKSETRKKMVKAGLTRNPYPFEAYWDKGLRFQSENGNFKLAIGGRIMNDWAWMTENKKLEDESGIGDLVDSTEFRRTRLYVSGTIYNNVGFKAQYDYEDGVADFKDVYIELKEIPYLGNFRVGHFKEPYSLEQLTSSKYISFMERNLTDDPFAPERNTGFMFHNHMLDKRVTWAAGVFRNTDAFGDSDIADSSNEGQYSFTGRLTGLPWYEEKGRKLLHVGLGYSWQNAESNSVTFETKPDINLAPDFVDTGTSLTDITKSYDLLGPELALVYGPFSLQAEYSFVDVDLKRSVNSDPDFSGFYVYGSYFITGENRGYKTANGTFSRVKPKSNFKWGKSPGAIELLARYSELDLSDEAVDAGRLDTMTLGVNWYLNPNTRVMFNYVKADPTLDSDGDDDGDADLFAMRFQIDF
ncbi:MAG: porin [Candidatus Scalindua sp.]